MGASSPRRMQQCGYGNFSHVAVEQRRTQRAVGFGADQSGQGDLQGARHRYDGNEANQAGQAVLCG